VTDPAGASATGASAATINVQPPSVDLTGAFAKTPRTAKTSGKLPVTIAVSNAGNSPAAGTLAIHLTAAPSDSPGAEPVDLGTYTARLSTAPGKKSLVRLTATLPAGLSGSLVLAAELNSDHAIDEVNVDNNVFASSAVQIG